jgi:hypothetical protein
LSSLVGGLDFPMEVCQGFVELREFPMNARFFRLDPGNRILETTGISLKIANTLEDSFDNRFFAIKRFRGESDSQGKQPNCKRK